MPRRKRADAADGERDKPLPGEEFENIVASVFRQFADTATVTENDRILGRSGELRQIDVSLRTSVVGSELLVIVECKDYSRPVSQGRIDELIGKMEDVGAAKAVLVSDSGFTTGAVKRAEANGRIQLVSVLDTENKKLRSRIHLPIHVEFHDVLFPFNVGFSQETGSKNLSDAELYRLVREHIPSVIRDFFDCVKRTTPEMGSGTHVYRQLVLRTNEHSVFAEISFEKRVRRYFNRDIFARGIGVFDHVSKRLLASTGLDKVSIVEDEVVRSWLPIGPDFKAPEHTQFFRRMSWYNFDTAEDFAQDIMRQFERL